MTEADLAAMDLGLRGALTLILASGGIYSLYKGFQLIYKGVRRKTEGSTISFGILKASTSSIGALVMITASLWGYLAVLARPVFSGPTYNIATITNINEDLDTIGLTTSVLASGQIELRQALADLENQLGESTISIDIASTTIHREIEGLAKAVGTLESKVSSQRMVRDLRPIKRPTSSAAASHTHRPIPTMSKAPAIRVQKPTQRPKIQFQSSHRKHQPKQ